MEAEHYQTNVSLAGYAWTPVSNAGYSGTGALRALPNDGPDPLVAGAGPRLEFQVQFTRTGTHYIWIRALTDADFSDSLYVGLDGATGGALNISGLTLDGRTWTWTNKTMAGSLVAFNVTSLGVHTVNVWMRESGIVLDKLVVTTSASYVPTGTGPAESALNAAAAPTVTTNAATAITAIGGTVNGGVNPNGAATTAWFEWGTDPALATFTSTTSQSLGSGTSSQSVSAVLSGLTSGTPYYFRVAASSAAGTSKGSILGFNTTAVVPTVMTNAATRSSRRTAAR